VEEIDFPVVISLGRLSTRHEHLPSGKIPGSIIISASDYDLYDLITHSVINRSVQPSSQRSVSEILYTM
jgi:hypothetical protein